MRLIGTGTRREGSGRVAGLSSKKERFETVELELVKLKHILIKLLLNLNMFLKYK